MTRDQKRSHIEHNLQYLKNNPTSGNPAHLADGRTCYGIYFCGNLLHLREKNCLVEIREKNRPQISLIDADVFGIYFGGNLRRMLEKNRS